MSQRKHDDSFWRDFLNKQIVRWTDAQKANVCIGLELGKFTRAQLLAAHPSLTDQELSDWEKHYERGGRAGLAVTRNRTRKGRAA